MQLKRNEMYEISLFVFVVDDIRTENTMRKYRFFFFFFFGGGGGGGGGGRVICKLWKLSN